MQHLFFAFRDSNNSRYRTMKPAFNFKKNRAWAEHLSIVMQLGLTMAGCICFCFFIGLYLDKWLGTKGILIAIFTVLGVIGGGIVAYRQILEVIAGDKKEENKLNHGSD